MRSRSLPVLLCLTALAAGCGNDPNPAVELNRAPASKTRAHRFPAAGISLELPVNLGVSRAKRPEVFRGSLGEAFVSAFAYRRREQLPRDDQELQAARRRLVRAVMKRSKSYELDTARTTRLDGARAIELLGDQTISQRRLRTRSLHVFRGKAEYVIEVVAPVGEFARFDRGVTPLLRRTADLTGRVRAAR